MHDKGEGQIKLVGKRIFYVNIVLSRRGNIYFKGQRVPNKGKRRY